MKFLFVHNKYGIDSGEEIMIRHILGLLEQQSHAVETFYKESATVRDNIQGKMKSFVSGINLSESRTEIRNTLDKVKPDLVQIQNLYPLISPSILPEIRSYGLPIVMRLSNYRLICPSGMFLSHGKICEKCRDGNEYWCVLKNCESSIFKSTAYALRNAVARKKRYFLDNVSHYYAQTKFQKASLVAEGFLDDSISVIPNMIEPREEDVDCISGSAIGFVGRMSPEKGAQTLLAAAMLCKDIPFKFAGTQKHSSVLDNVPKGIELLGHLDRSALDEFYRDIRLLVVPSQWYEGFPNVILEAMQFKKPVICSNIGGLPEIVDEGETGLLFEPGNAEELAEKIQFLWERPQMCRDMGEAGYQKLLREYTPEKYYSRLMCVYEKAMQEV